MGKKKRMNEVVRRLKMSFVSNPDRLIREPFHVLIATILSQNTSDRNSQRAFSRLKKSFQIKPQVLANLKPEDIKPAIMIAGLSDVRSRRIVDISMEILTRFNGDVRQVFKLPLNEARRTLMSIKGIGPKTADILLSFVGGFSVMPVDTNIFRVVERLGFVKGRNYERTRKSLERLISSEDLLDMHLYLIRLGREICKPRKPICPICPVKMVCDYGKKYREGEN